MNGDPNRELLAEMARALGELRERLVFVGGCATGLLITDPAAAPVRATRDVDVIVVVATAAEYYRFADELRARGFTQTLEQREPPHRWTLAGMKLDVMPTSEEILGFSNRWYEAAMRTATRFQLDEGLSIRLVAPALFVATKLDAFLSRGEGDYLRSHDLEDVLMVVDGRPELVEELASSDLALQKHVSDTVRRMVEDESFLNVLPGLVLETGSPQGRVEIVLRRLHAISGREDGRTQ